MLCQDAFHNKKSDKQIEREEAAMRFRESNYVDSLNNITLTQLKSKNKIDTLNIKVIAVYFFIITSLFYLLYHFRRKLISILNIKEFGERLQFISIVLLIIALFSMPYGYYLFMRIAVSGISIYMIYQELQRKTWAFFFYCACLIVYNPIFKIHFRREEWYYIDAACAIFTLILVINNRKPLSNNSHYRS